MYLDCKIINNLTSKLKLNPAVSKLHLKRIFKYYFFGDYVFPFLEVFSESSASTAFLLLFEGKKLLRVSLLNYTLQCNSGVENQALPLPPS